ALDRARTEVDNLRRLALHVLRRGVGVALHAGDVLARVAQRGYQVHAAIGHQAQRVVLLPEVSAVLDRVHARVEGVAQPIATVGVDHRLALHAVRLVDQRKDLLARELATERPAPRRRDAARGA